jgi:hypothetical protein
MKTEITVGQIVKGKLLTASKGEQKYIEYEGIVCGKGRHRKTDLLVKVVGISKPFWVMSGSVTVK